MTIVRVRDLGAWDGNEGALLYAPMREHQISFVEALERAHPNAAVWWDRDVGTDLRGEIDTITLGIARLVGEGETAMIGGGLTDWYDGICEVQLHRAGHNTPPFYRLAIDERWYLVIGMDGRITPQWQAARDHLVRRFDDLIAKAVAAAMAVAAMCPGSTQLLEGHAQ